MKNATIKLILFLGILNTPIMTMAAVITSCPSGFATVQAQGINPPHLVSSYSTLAKKLQSCLPNESYTNDICGLFVPTNYNLSDTTGTYHYTYPCPLSN